MGTKIYYKIGISSEICSETPIILSENLSIDCIIIGLENLLDISQFEVFPNPNNGIFEVQINLNNQHQTGHLNLLNYLGKTMMSDNFTAETYKKQFDLSILPTGIYFLKLTVNDKTILKKIIKN